jgi:hypothetical protein
MNPAPPAAPKSNTFLWIAGIGVAVVALIYFGGKFFRSVVEAINKWQPADAADKETDHRKAVAGFLRTTLPGYTIIEEYGNERSRADLVICSSNQGVEKSQEKFVIELKYRMSSKAEVDRLIGQCIGYKQFGYDKVIILLIDTEPNMAEVLKARASVDTLAGFLTVVEIRKSAPTAIAETAAKAS